MQRKRHGSEKTSSSDDEGGFFAHAPASLGKKKARVIDLPVEDFPPDIPLPNEILCRLMEFIPVNPRLFCVSRVCKRWRCIAVLSVDAITENDNVKVSREALSLFPSLTELTVSLLFVKHIWVPQAIRKLTIAAPMFDEESDGYSLSFATPLPALTHADLRGLAASALYLCLSSIVHPSMHSLTSLTVHHKLTEPTLRYDSVYFPNLINLTLMISEEGELHPTKENAFTVLIQKHCSQLTSLTCFTPVESLIIATSNRDFPRLEFLGIGCKVGIRSFPALRSAAVRTECLEELDGPMLALTTELHCFPDWPKVEQVKRCPNVKRFAALPSLKSSDVATVRQLLNANYAHLITTVFFEGIEATFSTFVAEILLQCINLAELSFGKVADVAYIAAPMVPLSRLDSLSIGSFDKFTFVALLNFLREFMQFDSPTELRITALPAAPSPAAVHELRDLLVAMKLRRLNYLEVPSRNKLDLSGMLTEVEKDRWLRVVYAP